MMKILKKISKISHQIFIIFMAILIIFIAKNEIIEFYNSSILSLKNKKIFIESKIEETRVIDLSKIIKTPGALRVFNDIIFISKHNVILSAKNIIELTNKQRIENGNLLTLKENSKLNFSAEKKLQDMFIKQYFDHISPEGIGVNDLGEQVYYEYIIIGENLATGNFKDDEMLVNAWMESPGHRANILNKHYTETGVAVDKGIFEGKEVWMAVQHFALPKNACPIIDEVLKGVINYNEKQIVEYGKDLFLRRKNINDGVIFEGMTTNEQIDVYNTKVIIYNKLVNEVKLKIIEYNKQVADFNLCLSKNLE